MKEIKTDYNATLVYGYDHVTGLDGLIIESGGGNRNVDHSVLFKDIIQKLSNINARNVSIYVAAKSTLSNYYPNLEYRKITYNGESNFDFKYIDLDSFITSVNNEIREKGKIDPNKPGGSVHKRLIFISDLSENDWIDLISGNRNASIENSIYINNKTIEELEFVYQKVKKRIKQSKFRKELLVAYNNTCAVTGSQVIDLLDAAHIIPYFGEQSNVVTNGILLRTDIHELFDTYKEEKRLLNITKDYIIRLHQSLKDSEYWKLNGKKIFLPLNEIDYPKF